MVVTAGEIILIPAALTRPIPWSILTELAPVTFHSKADVPPGLIVAGLLLNTPITGGVGFGAWTRNVKQPGMRISSSNSDKEKKAIFFNLVTSKNMLPAT
jgi:hypothetical protein